MSGRDAQDGASEPGGSIPAAQAAPRRGSAAPRRLLLEPWGVGYAGSAQDVGGTAFGDADDDPLGGPGDERRLLGAEALSVEVPLADWRALRPAAPLAVAQLLFLDGVRRVEARAVLEGAAPAFGALGSCAVGAVACDLAGGGRAAIVEDVVVERWCAIAIDALTDETDVLVPTGPTGPAGSGAEAAPRLRFRVTQAKGTDWQAPVEQLQVVMRDAERRLAARLRGRLAGAGEAGSRALLVCDGPRPLFGADENVIGYLKTIKEQRLPAAALAVGRRLEEGEGAAVVPRGEAEDDPVDGALAPLPSRRGRTCPVRVVPPPPRPAPVAPHPGGQRARPGACRPGPARLARRGHGHSRLERRPAPALRNEGASGPACAPTAPAGALPRSRAAQAARERAARAQAHRGRAG